MSDKSYLSVYAKSFSWAGFFLPRETLKKCSVLYDFCRVADNIADDKDEIEVKEKKFAEFENDFNQKKFDNLIIKNMWGIMEEFNISIKIVQDLLAGIRSDIKEKVEINSKKDLLIYSYRVAGTVGLMMAKILNVTKKNSLKSAIDLGIAMQLTNISRDVIEDKNLNRYYIKSDIKEIKDTLELAETFYRSCFYYIKDIPFRLRFSICVARRVYREIGFQIKKKSNFEEYKNSGKIFVNNFGKIIQTLISLLDMIKLSLMTNQETGYTQNKHKIIMEEINLNERF